MRFKFLVVALLLALGFHTAALAEILADPIRHSKEVRNGGEHVVFTNISAVPVSIKLALTLHNVKVSGPSDLIVVPALGSVEGPAFFPSDPANAWSYNWTYRYNFGSYQVEEPTEPFRLPWAVGSSFAAGQAFGGDRSHTGDDRYAVDFPMPEGTPIHASRAGLVCYVRENFWEGGWDPALRAKDNHVLIAHADGTLSRYLHLRHEGAVVELGQWVEAGELIGFSGNVGFSSGPHLHFDVVRPGRDLVTQTVPFLLISNGVPETPSEGAILSH
jgi:murein DD-endopeptidase MepM/ murein hydrolase activator NlpD